MSTEPRPSFSRGRKFVVGLNVGIGLAAAFALVVMFDAAGSPEYVRATELSEYDYEKLLARESSEVKRTHFKGEQRFTSAIFRATHPRPLKAYYLQDHGEHDLNGTQTGIGYSALVEVLRESKVKVDSLSLLGNREV